MSQAIQQHEHSGSGVEALVARLQPQIDSIDLESDINDSVAATIAFAELSDASVGDFAKKLMILEDKGIVSASDVERILIHRHVKA